MDTMSYSHNHSSQRHRYAIAILILLAGIIMCPQATAQEFKVTSVTQQKNDVTAFISPVYDLTNTACALLKVEAPADFAFSSPLGIIKRKDEVGEIYLYLPHGSKLITIKHPQWGVIRNYRLPEPLESRMCYVMKIMCPEQPHIQIHDTVVVTKTLVDTVRIEKKKEPVPWAHYALATLSLHKPRPSVGLMFASMKRHGLFLNISTDFGSTGNTVMDVDKTGRPVDGGDTPYYTGKSRYSDWRLTAGLIHRITREVNIFEGAGYGNHTVAWQLDDAEGGGYVRSKDDSYKGITAEIGVMWHRDRWAVMMSAATLKGHIWYLNIGVGLSL